MPDAGSDQFKHLLQPDSVLPSQYRAGAAKRVRQEPVVRLIEAMLRDAVECFQKHLFASKRKHQDAFREAELWICSTDRSWPFAFENVCDILGIEPNYLRRGLLEWKERQLSRQREYGESVPMRDKPRAPAPRRCRPR